jgi:adenosylmethionine-8-amino-7-oxononanoate aminotransferase
MAAECRWAILWLARDALSGVRNSSRQLADISRQTRFGAAQGENLGLAHQLPFQERRPVLELGLLGAIEIASDPEAFGQRARAIADRCLANGVFVRALGETAILSPPPVIEESQIGQVCEAIATAAAASS